MPELPEVEQVRISLLPHIVGKTIEKVRVDLPKMILHPDPDAFARRLQGARFTGVRRRGKYLGLELEGGDWLLVHLRMTGALLALPKDQQEPPYTRMAFFLSGRENLYLRISGPLGWPLWWERTAGGTRGMKAWDRNLWNRPSPQSTSGPEPKGKPRW